MSCLSNTLSDCNWPCHRFFLFGWYRLPCCQGPTDSGLEGRPGPIFRPFGNLIAHSSSVRSHLQIVCLFWLPFFHYFLLLELLIIIIDFSFPYLASLLQFVDIFNDHVQVLKILRRISNFLLLLPLAHVGCIRVKRVSCRYWVLRNILLKLWIVGDLLPNRTAAWGWVELSDVLLRGAIPDPGGFQLTAYFQKLVLQLLKYLWITKCFTIHLNLLWLKHYKCFGAPKSQNSKIHTFFDHLFARNDTCLTSPFFSHFHRFSLDVFVGPVLLIFTIEFVQQPSCQAHCLNSTCCGYRSWSFAWLDRCRQGISAAEKADSAHPLPSFLFCPTRICKASQDRKKNWDSRQSCSVPHTLEAGPF